MIKFHKQKRILTKLTSSNYVRKKVSEKGTLKTY